MEKSYVGMYQCYFCGEDIGVLLDKRLRNSLPRRAGVVNMEPCDKCKEYMKQGVVLISIADSTTEKDLKGPIPNPHRTGGWAVLKEEAIRKVLKPEFLEFVLEHRFMFITDEAWYGLGLEKGGDDESK